MRPYMKALMRIERALENEHRHKLNNWSIKFLTDVRHILATSRKPEYALSAKQKQKVFNILDDAGIPTLVE